jgi:DNA mismatch endonuclease, patch repair protein
MSRIRRRDTKPEMLLRRALWKSGLRYRVDLRVVGARPDIVFTRQRIAIFVDGCFWHGCPKHYIPPSGNAGYWSAKIDRNRARDTRNTQALIDAGYRVLRFWECDVKDEITGIVERIRNELSGG